MVRYLLAALCMLAGSLCLADDWDSDQYDDAYDSEYTGDTEDEDLTTFDEDDEGAEDGWTPRYTAPSTVPKTYSAPTYPRTVSPPSWPTYSPPKSTYTPPPPPTYSHPADLPSEAIYAPKSYTKTDPQSGNTYRVNEQLNGDTKINGYNWNTGSQWNTTIKPDGSMKGQDSNGNLWDYNSRSKTYMNYGTGEICTGEGATRICAGGD